MNEDLRNRIVGKLENLAQELDAIQEQRERMDTRTREIKEQMVQLMRRATGPDYTMSRLSEDMGRSRTWLAATTRGVRSKQWG